MKNIALITGATSGIGKTTAFLLAEKGYNLILTGRRDELLNEVSEQITLKNPINVRVLAFDIRQQSETQAAIENLPDEWKTIDVLINNAGLASGLSTIQDGDLDDWERMIDTNIKGLLYISRLVMPFMIERKKGHIINISSIAGKEVYPMGNVYCATKHAVEALTKGMRIDLLKHGIRVSSISPGMVETEFSIVRFHGDGEKAKNVYSGFEPLVAEDIAETVWFILSRPKHVTINDILIMPTAQANAVNTHRT